MNEDRKQLPGAEHGAEREPEGDQGDATGLFDGPQGLFRRAQAMRHQQRRIQRKAERDAQAGTKIPTNGGVALDGAIRARMEPQLGANLSHVRVHTGGESSRAADSLGARAFTTDGDVHFAAGEYAPGTKEGDRLIAHELTHTVQAQKSGVQRKAADESHESEAHEHDVSQPGEPAEQEADAVADAAADNLHGSGGKKVESPGKQAAPAIGAKLDGRKIFRAGKDPLRAGTKNALGAGPEVGAMRVGNAQQARVTKPPQHHVFPQNAKDKAWFAERGVDVDNFCVNLPQSDHELLHDVNDWNRQVMLLLTQAEKRKGKGQKLTLPEMVTAIQPLMAAAKLTGLPFVRYGSPRPDEGKK